MLAIGGVPMKPIFNNCNLSDICGIGMLFQQLQSTLDPSSWVHAQV